MSDAPDEWVQVGGKGRPRRTPHQQQQHLEARAKEAAILAAVTHSPPQHQHHHSRPQLDQQICTAAQQQNLAAVVKAVAQDHSAQQQQHLPGWGPPPEREWKTACSSKTKKKKGRQQQLPTTPEEQVQYLSQLVHEIAQQLKTTQMYASLLDAMQQATVGLLIPAPHQQIQHDGSSRSNSWCWGDVQQLVVYGLGSAEDSKVSRHQLALVLLLQQLLPGLKQPPQLYDPAFTAVDVLLLRNLGLQIIDHNEEGRRAVQGATFFYLPHCEGVLCDNLLCSNASSAALGHICILGNSFATYHQRWSGPQHSRPKTRRPDMLLQLVEQGAVTEVAVPDHSYHVPSAFNDMSLHTFPLPAAAAERN